MAITSLTEAELYKVRTPIFYCRNIENEETQEWKKTSTKQATLKKCLEFKSEMSQVDKVTVKWGKTKWDQTNVGRIVGGSNREREWKHLGEGDGACRSPRVAHRVYAFALRVGKVALETNKKKECEHNLTHKKTPVEFAWCVMQLFTRTNKIHLVKHIKLEKAIFYLLAPPLDGTGNESERAIIPLVSLCLLIIKAAGFLFCQQRLLWLRGQWSACGDKEPKLAAGGGKAD